MNVLDILANALGLTVAEDATDEAKIQAITAAITDLQAKSGVAGALLTALNATTQEEALATLATMVSREQVTALETQVGEQDVKLVLLEGQMSGKLTKADCEGEGWAIKAAQQSPTVLRTMLPNLPTKVATGQAIESTIASLQTRQHKGDSTVKTFKVGEQTFALTPKTKDYDGADIENLQDQIGRFGAERMIAQGLVALA